MVSKPLQVIEADRERLDEMLELILDTEDVVVRADLAEEMAVVAARCENVKADVLYPFLRNVPGSQEPLDRAEADQDSFRVVLAEMRGQTGRVKPVNALADDPDGFEQTLDALVRTLLTHLDREDDEVAPLVERLDPSETDELTEAMQWAATHPSSHPDPAGNPVLRKVEEIKETKEAIDLAVSDESTRWRPVVEALEGAAAEPQRRTS
jgi:hypothetical protein